MIGNCYDPIILQSSFFPDTSNNQIRVCKVANVPEIEQELNVVQNELQRTTWLHTEPHLPHSEGAVPSHTAVQAYAAERHWAGVPWCLLGVLGILVLPQCVWSALHIHARPGGEQWLVCCFGCSSNLWKYLDFHIFHLFFLYYFLHVFFFYFLFQLKLSILMAYFTPNFLQEQCIVALPIKQHMSSLQTRSIDFYCIISFRLSVTK